MSPIRCRSPKFFVMLASCTLLLVIIDDDFKRGSGPKFTSGTVEAYPMATGASPANDQEPSSVQWFDEQSFRELESPLPDDGPRLIAKRDEIQRGAPQNAKLDRDDDEQDSDDDDDEADEDDDEGQAEKGGPLNAKDQPSSLPKVAPKGSNNKQQQQSSSMAQQQAPANDPNDKPRILKGWGLGAGSWMLG